MLDVVGVETQQSQLAVRFYCEYTFAGANKHCIFALRHLWAPTYYNFCQSFYLKNWLKIKLFKSMKAKVLIISCSSKQG